MILSNRADITSKKLKKAVDLVREGKLVVGHRLLSEVVDFDPKDGYALVELAGVLKDLGRFKQAWDAYEMALEFAPQNRRAHVLASLALIAEHTHGPETAAKYYESSIECLRQEVAWIHILAANNYFNLGQWDRAEVLYDRAVQVESDEKIEALTCLAILQRARGSYEKARKSAEEALKIDPTYDLAIEIIKSLD